MNPPTPTPSLPDRSTSGKMIPMRPTIDVEPAERLQLRKVREAWRPLRVVTIAVAAPELKMTIRAIKHRRDDSAPDQFPEHITVLGHYMQAGQFYDLAALQLWKHCGCDLRNAAPADLRAQRSKVNKAVKAVVPAMLTTAAELMIADIVPELNADQLAAIEDGRAPELIHVARRRLRNWRETWMSTGFPEALPVEAVGRSESSIYSMVELRAWMKARKAAAAA